MPPPLLRVAPAATLHLPNERRPPDPTPEHELTQRPSGVRVEDFDLASCYTTAFDPSIGTRDGLNRIAASSRLLLPVTAGML